MPIEGPHEADRFWISRLGDDGRSYGIAGRPFEPDRWLVHGDRVTVGELVLANREVLDILLARPRVAASASVRASRSPPAVASFSVASARFSF